MSSWAGFSDEELRRMQQKDSAVPARGRKPAPANRSRQQLQREKALQVAAQRSAAAGSPVLPAGQQLTRPPQSQQPEPKTEAGAPNDREKVQEKPAETKPDENHEPAAEECPPPVQELEKQEVELREKTRLEQLQQERELIEENNKRKKALLTKTIAEKSRQTQAEAVKLKRIQKELQALDDMVSNDIGILRGKIEQASWDYTAARKRYEKAEAEYVMSKLDLHKKTEVKEQLTEHLCAIIQQNELRKALKLEELMQQLQLQASEEELEKQKEKEEKMRHCMETQREEKEENSSVKNEEETVLSTGDCKPTAEEIVKPENGGPIQPECKPVIEASTTEQDCTTPENCLQSEIVVS